MDRFIRKIPSLSHRTFHRYPQFLRCHTMGTKTTARWDSPPLRCCSLLPSQRWNQEPRWRMQCRMSSENASRAEPHLDTTTSIPQAPSVEPRDDPFLPPNPIQNHQPSSSSTKPIQSTGRTREKPAKEHEALVVARQLLNIPIGSFRNGNEAILEPSLRDAVYPIGRNPPTPIVNHYQMAADVLQCFLNDRNMCASNVRAINAAFAVLERLIREITYTNSAAQNMQYTFRNDTQFRVLINFWKNAALAGESVLPAIEMIKKVQWMTSELPSESNKIIQFDKMVLSMIFQVMLKQVPKDQAPLVAESLMEFVYATIDQTNNADLEPDIFIYGQILSALINSGRPDTPVKLEQVLNDMRRHDVYLNAVTYGMLIRYWAGKGSLTRMNSLLEQMIIEGLDPDIGCLGQALYGYTRAMQPLVATEILEKMYQKLRLKKVRESAQDRATITASTLNILDSFKRLVILGKDAATNITRAEEVVRKYSAVIPTKSQSADRVNGALMDIYAHAGRVDDVEAMMDKIDQRDPVKYSILVRAYGKMDRANLAMDVVFLRMLYDSNITPAQHVFKTLVEAWADSSQSDAFEQAYSVFHKMDESAICQQHNLRPDSYMYGSLLKVVGATKRLDGGAKAVAILDDMEKRARETNDKSLLPNKVTYDLALNVCLQGAHDVQRAEEILKRMEKSDYPPDIRLYNEVLSNYSLVNFGICFDATKRAESLLAYIKELSKSNPQLKPNDFTYNAVINCWIASNDTFASKHVWSVYAQMKQDFVLPNMGTFNAMIPFLSKSKRGFLDVRRADELLELMESGKITGVAPDRRHYGPIMNGWIANNEPQRAANVLLRRVKMYISITGPNKERCKPSPDHFYMVANGWIHTHQLVEATEFVQQIQTLADQGHLPEGPDLYSYLTLHSAWSRSHDPKAKQYLGKLDATILKMRQTIG